MVPDLFLGCEGMIPDLFLGGKGMVPDLFVGGEGVRGMMYEVVFISQSCTMNTISSGK